MTGSHQCGHVPDIRICDDESAMVEVSVPIGPRRRKFVLIECADLGDAAGLVESLRHQEEGSCGGGALRELLGCRQVEE